jgi:hypothetical protein
MRSLVIVAALVGAACSGSNTDLLPDGGRPRITCFNSVAVLAIRVVDNTGAPVDKAVVTAINLSTQKTLTSTTNTDGLAGGITEDVGPGVIKVTAAAGNSSSGEYNATFVCGECDCAVTPNNLTVALK